MLWVRNIEDRSERFNSRNCTRWYQAGLQEKGVAEKALPLVITPKASFNRGIWRKSAPDDLSGQVEIYFPSLPKCEQARVDKTSQNMIATMVRVAVSGWSACTASSTGGMKQMPEGKKKRNRKGISVRNAFILISFTAPWILLVLCSVLLL